MSAATARPELTPNIAGAASPTAHRPLPQRHTQIAAHLIRTAGRDKTVVPCRAVRVSCWTRLQARRIRSPIVNEALQHSREVTRGRRVRVEHVLRTLRP